MKDNGFTVKDINTNDMMSIKTQYKVPSMFQGCHTAIVDGYIVEGHVPAAEVTRLITEKPDILGIAVPGMPAGSPGMGSGPGLYDVIWFDETGKSGVYASYP